jgi:RsiW-degrading membrane proteinase PrsW (M82 family)
MRLDWKPDRRNRKGAIMNTIAHQLLGLLAVIPVNTAAVYFIFRKRHSIKSIFHALPSAFIGTVLGWLAAHFIR